MMAKKTRREVLDSIAALRVSHSLNLFPHVAEGGLIILDDYYFWDGCSKAVHDYLSSIKSTCRLYQSGRGVSYIVKKGEINEVGYRI